MYFNYSKGPFSHLRRCACYVSLPTNFGVSELTQGRVVGTLHWKLSAASPAVEDSPQKSTGNANTPLIVQAQEVEPASWKNIKEPPNVPIARKVSGAQPLPGIRLTLFQYQTCPFCCKVRAFLDYHGIPYDIVEVEPVLRQQIKFSTYKKVPIVLLREGNNCWQLNESSAIISILQSYRLNSEPGIQAYLNLYQPMKTKDPKGKEVLEVFNKYNLIYDPREETLNEDAVSSEIKWRRWADDHLVHVLSPNVYRSPTEALQAFNYFSDVGDWKKLFPAWERYLVIYVGAAAMYLVGKRLQKKYNLKEDVRLSFYEACDTWTDYLGNGKFAGGKRPNLADLAVFGVLSSVEGCAAFDDVLKHTKIQRWFNDMKTATQRTDPTY
ncbi:prostaglandin E synthase 2-like isoform X2 [Varroa destructor]|uniref:Prostaglandin E synthase 2 n=1 Tax=Varroa destructor TaxID=109461 RepID=A0A7M7JF94_VARDE|nr:prostaglandin E synthase 2-like isoform X2 [Varroa destructor]